MSDTLNPDGAGLSDAAIKFEALLTGEADNQTLSDELVADDSEVLTEESLEATESDDETPPESAETADEDGAEDEEAAADVEDDAEGKSEEIQLVTVKIDGKEEQIPLDEALRGYQRHADYSRKMNEVSQEYKALEAELNEIRTERAQYASLLESLQQQLQTAGQQEPNWQELYNENPLEYVRQKDLWRDRQDRLQAIASEQERLSQIQMQEQKQNISRIVQENHDRLIEVMPEWKDAKRWEQDRQAIRNYGVSLGFSEEELAQAYDYRAVLALHKAMKYDAIMAKRPQPKGKVNAPKVLGAGTQASAPKSRAHTAIASAKKRLAQTGDVADAAIFFQNLL